MGNLIMNLMAIASDESVTPVTRVTPGKVTLKPAWIKGVTRVTPVTHDFNDSEQEGGKLAFIRRVDALVQQSVISRQEGAGLVNQHMFWPDMAETRLNRIEVDSRMSKYYGHHFQCSKCISAGRGYGTRCDVGLALWESKP